MRHIIIGCGGIGGWVIRGLAPTLTPTDMLVLIDGDRYEPHNLTRQGQTSGGKAHYYERLAQTYRVPTQAIEAYITSDGSNGTIPAHHAIKDGDTVWVCPDNHATRRVAIERAEQLDNIVVLIGGNDGTDGNVLLYTRAAGVADTPHPFVRHPELQTIEPFTLPTPEEHEMSCAVRADAGDSQTVLANMQAAVCMLAVYEALRRHEATPHIVYFDTLPLGIRTVS